MSKQWRHYILAVDHHKSHGWRSVEITLQKMSAKRLIRNVWLIKTNRRPERLVRELMDYTLSKVIMLPVRDLEALEVDDSTL